MRARLCKRTGGRCGGLAMVEFVLVLPVCLMLLMATAEFGRVFLQHNTLTKAVRDGARYAAGKALRGSTGTVGISSGLADETRNVVVYGNTLGAGGALLPGLTTADVTVADAGSGDVIVTARYPYSSIFGFLPTFFFGNVNVSAYTLQAAITMRAL
jgi:Flp pilus assembly protein TadG